MRFKIPRPFNLNKIKFNLFSGSDSAKSEHNSDSVTASSSAIDNQIKDMGNAPYVFDIDNEIEKNTNYRTVIWTGKYLQLVLMNIPAGGEIGLEIHDDTDQFFRIESGSGEVSMGRLKDEMNYRKKIDSDSAVMVPAGTYHNIKNTGREPLKLYTVYAPPHHKFGLEETESN